MNILIFSWRGPGHPNSGGAEIVTHEYAKAWVRYGHQVTLFTSNYSGASKKEVIDGVTILRYGGATFGCKIRALMWYLFEKHSDFDLIFDHFHGIPFFTPLYIRKRKIAFVHEVAKEVWNFNAWPKPFNLIPSLLGPRLEPLIYRLYKHIPFWTVSESTKQDLISFGIPDQRITIIKNGINQVNTRVRDREKIPTVTYLGALAKDKGIEIALETFGIISEQMKNCQFWVIGKGDKNYLEQLKERCHQYKIQDKVIFWGFVSDKEKFKLLAKSHILVNPSSYEGWGLVVIEGALVGTPTVGFDVAGLRDSIKDQKTGILCEHNTAQELAKNVLILLRDLTKYRWLSINATKWSKQFNWKNSIKESLRQIERIN